MTCSKSSKCVYRILFVSYIQPHVTLPTALCWWRTMTAYSSISGSRWPRGLRRGSASACFLLLWIWIWPGAWVYYECWALSGSSLYDGPGEPFLVYVSECLVECNIDTSTMWRSWPTKTVEPLEKNSSISLISQRNWRFSDTLRADFGQVSFTLKRRY